MTTNEPFSPGGPEPGPHRLESVATYLVIYAVLQGLLVLTVAVAFLHFGPLTIVVALGIASIKAGLIAVYFMHLRLSTPLTRVFAAAGLLWLGILFALTFGDYLTRAWLPMSRGWTQTQPR